MNKKELEKEAGDYADKHAFRVPYDGSNKFYDDVDFKASKEGYLAGAKPREKRIEELENKIADIKANCDLAIEGRDIKIKELEQKLENIRYYLENEIPHEFINEATTIIYKMV